ncbi:MAG: hypothetical protein M1825_003418 [Sarcosagium campestre]|nr:MAG: hypothetical protein M1825_003418 [Sarcosagium campestre]
MTSLIAKYVGKRILGETAKNHFGTEDPYFETVPATRLGGKPKKRRKALPPGLSDKDAKILVKAKRRAYRLDMGLFNFCGIRFGWGSVIGLVPVIGDVLDALLALMVIRTCTSVGTLPTMTKMTMIVNLAMDFVVGLIPFVGDLVDAAYKCNTRNVVLLENHLRDKAKKNRQSQGHQQPAFDPSLGENYDRSSDEEPDVPPSYKTTAPGATAQQPTRPERVAVPSTDRAGGRGFFGFGSQQQRGTDVEMGQGVNPPTSSAPGRSRP